VFNDGGIGFLGGLMKSPERKSGEEDERCEERMKEFHKQSKLPSAWLVKNIW
jgi:hypothetical protein